MLIYDCEIIKAIEDKKHPKQDGIESCFGWHDHENMGLSCVCCYDYLTDRYRVFLEDDWEWLQSLFNVGGPLVGFNNIGFDNKLLRANSFNDNDCYDILQQIWMAESLNFTILPILGIASMLFYQLISLIFISLGMALLLQCFGNKVKLDRRLP